MPETHTQPSSPNDIKHARLARLLDRLCAALDQFVRDSSETQLSAGYVIDSEQVKEAAGILRELTLTSQADRLERGYKEFSDRWLNICLGESTLRLLDAQVQSDLKLVAIGQAGQLADFLRELRSDLGEMRLPKSLHDAAAEETKRSVKRPVEDAFKAYRLRDATGMSQSGLAEVLTKRLGKPVPQGQVSRWLSQVEHYLEAGNILPVLTTPTSKPQAIDPSKIDMGERTDGHSPRQRQKRAPNSD